jgi:hypothetical protein
MAAPLVEPTLTSSGLEFSIHTCPRALRSELAVILRGVDITALLIVCTCQRAAMDLVAVGDAVDAEKDALLVRFTSWAGAVCQCLAEAGFWADYVDPCSGLLVRDRKSNVLYPEVDSMGVLLRYKVLDAGPCHILLHPRWGSACYPASMMTTAPLDALRDAIHAVSSAGFGEGPSRPHAPLLEGAAVPMRSATAEATPAPAAATLSP